MTIPAAGPGPVCETCQAEPAIISLMQLADWSQLRIGANCAPEVLRGFADSMDGRTTTLPEPDVPHSECELCGHLIPEAEMARHIADTHGGGNDALAQLTQDQREAILAAMAPEDADAIRTVPARSEGADIHLPSGQIITWAEWLALGGQHDPQSGYQWEQKDPHWSGAGKVVRSTHGHRKPKGGTASAADTPADTDAG